MCSKEKIFIELNWYIMYGPVLRLIRQLVMNSRLTNFMYLFGLFLVECVPCEDATVASPEKIFIYETQFQCVHVIIFLLPVL